MANIDISLLIRVGLIILGMSGFFLARFIQKKKATKKRLVCPLRSDCSTVIHSSYSRFAGMRVEYIGMVYYAFVAVFYLAQILGSRFADLSAVGMIVSAVAMLFSVYLVLVQIFTIRQFCFWCLCSAGTCLCIFGGTFVLYFYF